MKKLLRLTLLWLLAIPCLLWSVLTGLWDWLWEIRQVWWHVRSMWQVITLCHREIRDPGCDLRERVARMMPTTYREKTK